MIVLPAAFSYLSCPFVCVRRAAEGRPHCTTKHWSWAAAEGRPCLCWFSDLRFTPRGLFRRFQVTAFRTKSLRSWTDFSSPPGSPQGHKISISWARLWRALISSIYIYIYMWVPVSCGSWGWWAIFSDRPTQLRTSMVCCCSLAVPINRLMNIACLLLFC